MSTNARKFRLALTALTLAALALSVFGAVPSQAASPVTVPSATMVFVGDLDASNDGTLPMINEDGTGLGDGVAGFDVFARNDAIAMYMGTTDYVHGPVTDNDAYTTGGGWGSIYDPDCADWYNYQLKLDGGEWYLEYNNNVGNDGILTGAIAPPMSGVVDWDHGTDGYAVETGVGEYYANPSTTAKDYGYALSNPWTNGDGKATWDMDWSWGSEYIPLGYPGFDITIEPNVDGTKDRVTLTPACMPVWLEFEGGKDWVEVGGTRTIDVMMSGSGFNGVDLDLIYLDAYLDGGSVSEGSMWWGHNRVVMKNETSSGVVYFIDYLQNLDETLGGTHMQVAQFDLIGQNDHDDSTITLVDRIRIVDLDGKALPVCGENDTLTVHGHGSVEGDVQLQGRFVGGGSLVHHAGASVKITGGPGGGFNYTGSTNANGHWSISGVIEGDYDVEVDMDLYLSAERSASVSFTVEGGGTADAGFVKMLGGDCAYPGDNHVGSLDASVVGALFGLSHGDPGWNPRGDINDDYTVDILDCSILGGNWGKNGPIAW